MGFEIRHTQCQGIIQGRTCRQCGWRASIIQWILSTQFKAGVTHSKEDQYHLLPQTRQGKLVLLGCILASIGIGMQIL